MSFSCGRNRSSKPATSTAPVRLAIDVDRWRSQPPQKMRRVARPIFRRHAFPREMGCPVLTLLGREALNRANLNSGSHSHLLAPSRRPSCVAVCPAQTRCQDPARRRPGRPGTPGDRRDVPPSSRVAVCPTPKPCQAPRPDSAVSRLANSLIPNPILAQNISPQVCRLFRRNRYPYLRVKKGNLLSKKRAAAGFFRAARHLFGLALHRNQAQSRKKAPLSR